MLQVIIIFSDQGSMITLTLLCVVRVREEDICEIAYTNAPLLVYGEIDMLYIMISLKKNDKLLLGLGFLDGNFWNNGR